MEKESCGSENLQAKAMLACIIACTQWEYLRRLISSELSFSPYDDCVTRNVMHEEEFAQLFPIFNRIRSLVCQMKSTVTRFPSQLDEFFEVHIQDTPVSSSQRATPIAWSDFNYVTKAALSSEFECFQLFHLFNVISARVGRENMSKRHARKFNFNGFRVIM